MSPFSRKKVYGGEFSDRHSFDECQRQQVIAAQRYFDDPPYAGAKYTTSFSDNAKSRISPQLFGHEAPTGAIADNPRLSLLPGCQ
jgi:hypothetical protein